MNEAKYLMYQEQKPGQQEQAQLENVANETQQLALLIQLHHAIQSLDLKTWKGMSQDYVK